MSEEAIARRLNAIEATLADLQGDIARLGTQMNNYTQETKLVPYHTANARRAYGLACGDVGAAIGHMRELHEALQAFSKTRAGK